jgi:FKBP-type peptidyl-prolyl cis-trans isomerase
MKNTTIPLIALSVIALVAIVFIGGNRLGDDGGQTASVSESIAPANPNGLAIEDTAIGSGPAVATGDTVSVHYTGTLADGTKFDSSHDRGEPFTFTVGAGQVIRGWEEGLVGMQVGGERKLTIPPALAYGDRSVGSIIPANATLTFEIELVSIAE